MCNLLTEKLKWEQIVIIFMTWHMIRATLHFAFRFFCIQLQTVFLCLEEVLAGPSLCSVFISFVSLLLVFATIPFSLYLCLKVIQH